MAIEDEDTPEYMGQGTEEEPEGDKKYREDVEIFKEIFVIHGSRISF
jgi:hypothetical protein